MPEVTGVHIDAALTNLSVSYPAGNLISQRLFPDLPVLKKSDEYYILDASRRAISLTNTLRQPGTAASEVDYDVTTDTYTCDGHALAGVVPDEERENADPAIQPEVDKTEFITTQVMVAQEIECKTALDAALTGAKTSTPAGTWDNHVTGDPFKDVKTAIDAIEDATGLTPNVMALDTKTFRAMANHPDIIDRIKYTGTGDSPAIVSARTIAELFQLEDVIIARAFKNTAVENNTAAISRIWGSDVYLAFRAARPGLKIATLGLRFCWAPFSGSVNGWMVSKGREEKRHADWVEVQKYYQQKVVMAAAGYRLQARHA